MQAIFYIPWQLPPGALLSFLIEPCEEAPITRLAGVDINYEILQETQKSCRPWSYDHEFLRSTPLTIDLYQGAGSSLSDILTVTDAIYEYLAKMYLFNT